MAAKMLLQSAVLAQTDELRIHDLAERYLPERGDRVVMRRYDHQAVNPERTGFQISEFNAIHDDADIRQAFRDTFDGSGAGFFLQIDVDMGIGGKEGGQGVRQELGHGHGVRL